MSSYFIDVCVTRVFDIMMDEYRNTKAAFTIAFSAVCKRVSAKLDPFATESQVMDIVCEAFAQASGPDLFLHSDAVRCGVTVLD